MPNVLFEALCAALDQFDAGFVAVSTQGKILHANRTAREMMGEGWPIRSSGGFLQAENQKATEKLLNGLHQAVCMDICLATSSSPRGAAIATMRPLINAKVDGSGCTIAVFVTSIKSRDDCVLSGIAECFALTPAETRTLHHFLKGSTVAEAGRSLAISENTVKTHLQNIFAKTRSSRQQHLIKLVNGLRPLLKPARVGQEAPVAFDTGSLSAAPSPSPRDAVSL